MSASTVKPTSVRRTLRHALTGAAALVFAAAAAAAETPPDVRNSQLHSYRVVPVVDGLVQPWSMAWLPNGDMLVTERPGRLRIVRAGALVPDAVPGVPAVRYAGQGGLFDVAPSPSFATNHLIYLAFSKAGPDDKQSALTVVTAKLEHDKLTDVKTLFEAAPFAQRPGQYGGRLVFDGKGHLFVSSGDGMAAPEGDLAAHPAQQLSSDLGKILRFNEDGSIPKDNPFVGQPNAKPEIWSIGHRNPEGLALNPATGDLWETEHGPQGGDELNLIRPKRNYGWPVITYGQNYNVGTDIGPRAKEGLEQPAAFWVPSIAPSGLMVYTGDKFPKWQGNVFAGGLSGGYQQLSRVMLEGTRVTNREPLMQLQGRIRDVRQGPDGLIYIAFDNLVGKPTGIVRLEPVN
jgi:glucose/arabinose dehydrogenase